MSDKKQWTSPVPATVRKIVQVDDDLLARALRQYLGMPNGDFSRLNGCDLPDGPFTFTEDVETEIIPTAPEREGQP